MAEESFPSSTLASAEKERERKGEEKYKREMVNYNLLLDIELDTLDCYTCK